MDTDEYKRFTLQAQSGIKGEAFFELLLSNYALPHRIVGPKDIGIDYICEWVYGDRPTGVLFIAQVKTFTTSNIRPKWVQTNERFNGLEQYQISKTTKLQIDPQTLDYWRRLGLPAYLFVMIQEESGEKIDCFYRRYTHPLTASSPDPSGEYYESFYKVNRGATFIAFKDPNDRIQGFARDLFIDHVRWAYAKGSIAYPDPKSLGLNQFQPNSIFEGLFKEYKEQIISVHNITTQYLQYLDL